MLPYVRFQHRPWNNGILQVRLCKQRSTGVPVALGHLLWQLRWTNWLCCVRRDLNSSSEGPDNFVQLGLLWHWLVSQYVQAVFCLLITSQCRFSVERFVHDQP